MIGRRLPFEKPPAPQLIVLQTERALPSSPVTLMPQDQLAELNKLLPDDLGSSEQVELLAQGVGGFGQPYAVIGAGDGGDWEILFFNAGELGWELIARTTLVGQRGHVPVARYVSGTPGALVLTHVDGYGTGIFRRSMTWYRIAKGQAVPLLSYPLDFYISGWGQPFDRRLTTTVRSMPEKLQEGAKLELFFTTEYTISMQFEVNDNEAHLFSEDHQVCLRWNEVLGKFIPNASKDNPRHIDELWSESTADWINRNIARLRHLKTNGTPEQKAFIECQLRLAAFENARDRL
jgi:hypothetical protein